MVSTASDAPLADDVVVLDERDRRRAGVWRDVCRWRDRLAARALCDRAGPRLRSAACSTARNLAVAALRLAVGCVSGEGVAWAPWSGRTGAGGQLDHERSDEAGADDAGDHPGRSPAQPATVCTAPRTGLGRRVNPPWVLGAVCVGGCCCVLLGLERAHDLLGSRSVASRHAERRCRRVSGRSPVRRAACRRW